MVVIHPKDKTTAMLSVLYEGLEVRLIDQRVSNSEVKHFLNHISKSERILLLGHGSDKGLFSRENDNEAVFDRLVINHSHAYYLRKHGGNIVALWCHADLFARKEGLHGLFSGMVVSEMNEALAYGIETTQEELERENIKLAKRLRFLFDEDIPLMDVPVRMLELDDVHSSLTNFNYNNFFYL